MSHTLAQDFATVREFLGYQWPNGKDCGPALARIEQRMGELTDFPFDEIARDEHGFPITREDYATLRARIQELEAQIEART